ncbi:hypothetical protein [Nocardia mangyaensis]|uniref:hypothetical protein n=1 Tax=Nocardia mangyaensis TaxID=2213200 RepID=UPI0026746D01|nr:hypothetical protein [Nocardia mangyaensis]MDO3645390.1 hypothetical protein [Nocardia mangyaensis]
MPIHASGPAASAATRGRLPPTRASGGYIRAVIVVIATGPDQPHGNSQVPVAVALTDPSLWIMVSSAARAG